ncbi:MAG: DegV family protein [Actinomycetota bacterium]|nr:DegV family protein [Actinomycetota bacterium]
MKKGKKRCNIIVDSCCDLPREVVDTLEVDLMEFPFSSDDGTYLDDLWSSMTAHEFYERMRAGEQPQTAQIPVPVFIEHFTRALESGIPTVYLSFSSGLSGSYDTACSIAESLAAEHPEGELHVVDTRLACIAEGMLVLEAVHQRDRGLTAKELVEWVEEARNYVHGYFTLDSLEALRRGGRIPDMAAYAGTKLDIKPLLTFDLAGLLTISTIARGRKKSLRALVSLLENRPADAPNSPIIVASADAPKDADHVAEKVTKQISDAIIVRTDVGPVIGSHVGPGMVAFAFFGVDRRKNISIGDLIAHKVVGKGKDGQPSGLGAVLGTDGDV